VIHGSLRRIGAFHVFSSLSSNRSLLDHFSALRDPREGWRVLYPLPEILLLVLCATLSGMEDFVEIRLWGEQRIDFLRRLLPFDRGLPAHDTLNDVVNALDAELFKTLFANWAGSLREAAPDLIAIDGKTSRRSHARAKGREPLHLVSAWAARQRLVLGQEAVDRKSNEIVAIPLLLERLELAGALVTIDAMGTQVEIAQRIVAGGGDYLLALKANRPALHEDVAVFFDNPPSDMLETPHTTTDADHGRIEQRRHTVCHHVDWLFSDRRYADEPRFPHLAMIGVVESRIERNGAVATERRYYLSSAKLDGKTFAAAVRAHWGVENRLHWVLDVLFHDDLARLRTGNGPQNMAVVKHMAMNLVRNPNDKHSLKVRQNWQTSIQIISKLSSVRLPR
jgi:predicted transposase YbfD/YdcC